MMTYQGAPLLSHTEVASLIAAVGHKRTVLVQGENGIGKSALLATLKAMPQFASHLFPTPVDCAQLDIGDHVIPVPDMESGTTRGLPNERYGINAKNQKGINGSRPVVVMMDELAKAPKHIQASLAPFFYEHRVGSFVAPEGSVIFGTTNLGVEGLGDFMPAHTRNRIIVVTMRKPNAEELVAYASANNWAPEIIAFMTQYPKVLDSFIDYAPGGKYEKKDLARDNPYIFNPAVQQTAYASPRSLHAASDQIKEGIKLPPHVLQAGLCGTLGVETGRELETYVRFGRELPTKERILQDPKNCPLPTSPTAQVVQVFKMVLDTDNRTEADKFLQYVERMKDEMVSVFLVTAARHEQKIQYYALVERFLKLLKEHQIYFAGSK